MSRPMQADSQLQALVALPNGAAAVVAPGIDLEVVISQDDFQAQTELLVTAPALTTGQLANGATMTYDIVDSPDNATWTTRVAGAYVQTGAGGVGAALNQFRYHPPSNTQRYVSFRATNSGAGNCSGVNAEGQLVF